MGYIDSKKHVSNWNKVSQKNPNTVLSKSHDEMMADCQFSRERRMFLSQWRGKFFNSSYTGDFWWDL